MDKKGSAIRGPIKAPKANPKWMLCKYFPPPPGLFRHKSIHNVLQPAIDEVVIFSQNLIFHLS